MEFTGYIVCWWSSIGRINCSNYNINRIMKIREFLHKLISANGNGDISSNRFLGVFVFTPALLFLLFFSYDVEYVYAVIGLLSALLVTNALAKHKNFKDKI